MGNFTQSHFNFPLEYKQTEQFQLEFSLCERNGWHKANYWNFPHFIHGHFLYLHLINWWWIYLCLCFVVISFAILSSSYAIRSAAAKLVFRCSQFSSTSIDSKINRYSACCLYLNLLMVWNFFVYRWYVVVLSHSGFFRPI